MKARLIGSTSLLALGLMMGSAGAQEQTIGMVVEDYRGAEGVRIGGTVEQLHRDIPVYSNERVITEADESTRLQFLDESQLYVGANSLVVLDRFVYDPASQLGEAALSFGKGAFRFVSGQMQNEEDIHLRTPKTALVIRGTTISIFLLNDGTEVIASEDGSIGVTACPGGGAEGSAELTAGDAVAINYVCELTLGRLTGPVPDTPEFPGFRSNDAGPTGGRPGQDHDRGSGPGRPAEGPPQGGDSSSGGEGGYGN